jgi:hypothetical protein
MERLSVKGVVEEIDRAHAELAQLSVRQFLGSPSTESALDVLEAHPLPLRPSTTEFLTKSIGSANDPTEAERLERVLFGCMDLAVAHETAALEDMVSFYMQRGFMHVGGEKIPAPEVVTWLQAQPDFAKREAMQKENSIFLKAIVNPMLMGILELTIRTVTEKFGFADYARYCEAKKRTSFSREAQVFGKYLEETRAEYMRRMAPWVQEVIGKPFSNLSRYHALYLVRIREFDDYFRPSELSDQLNRTFQGIGYDLHTRKDVILDTSRSASKNPNGICLGVKIPGNVHVVMRPVGGLIDIETLLHETGHAFFLSNFSDALPLEYRRLYRSPSLDEAFAFLFMNLIENTAWLTEIAGMQAKEAEKLAGLNRTKRFCLIRRYIGKFLAEKDLHESKDIKDPTHYCRYLENATGFIYEPQGYLIDMEPGFYALDYLHAWGGADVLAHHLEAEYGREWFKTREAGDFLRSIASLGRKNTLEEALMTFCGAEMHLPRFSAA